MRSLTVYQAGPITGCSYQGCTDWRRRMREELPEFIFLSPMRAKPHLEGIEEIAKSYDGTNDLKTLLSGSRGINARDSWDVRTCDVVFANLEAAEIVSIGTVMEIAWGWLLRKPTIVVHGKSDLHRHPMLDQCTDYLCGCMEHGITVLKALR